MGVAIMLLDEDLSKRINSLRFLLIVFVVFIHNNVSSMNFVGGMETYEIPVYVEKVRYAVSDIIARVAVPLFFLISGLLLYAKETSFLAVLKKKSRTILLPYLLWNALALAFFFVAQGIPFAKPYFANPQNIVRNFSAIDWLDVFVGKFTRTPYPLVYQFWFLRDLFILDLLFLPIKALIDKVPAATLALLVILWLTGANIYIVDAGALLFFALGYYIVKFNISYKHIDALETRDVIAMYALAIIMSLFFVYGAPTMKAVNIVVGIVFFIKMSRYFAGNKLYPRLLWLKQYAFFVYAIHEPLLIIMKKLSVRVIPMRGGWILLQYFGVATLGILIFLVIGIIVRKAAPKVYAALTGGRV
jgi:hypothetical protein